MFIKVNVVATAVQSTSSTTSVSCYVGRWMDIAWTSSRCLIAAECWTKRSRGLTVGCSQIQHLLAAECLLARRHVTTVYCCCSASSIL